MRARLGVGALAATLLFAAVALLVLDNSESSTTSSSSNSAQDSSNVTTTMPVNIVKDLSTFEWRLDWRQPSYGQTLQRLKDLGATEIYVELSAVGYDNADPTLKEDLQRLVEQAQRLDLGVQALLGDPNWATETEPLIRALDWIDQYNQTERPVTGVQIDVEPWGLAEWADQPVELSEAYLNMIQRVVTDARDELPLTFAIPSWWDTQPAVPLVTFNDQRLTPFDHMLQLLSGSNHQVLVMAYTTRLDGANGSLARSQRLLEQTDRFKVQTIVAIETAPVDEPITYFGDLDRFNNDLPILQQQLSAYKTFRGLSIHDTESWLALVA